MDGLARRAGQGAEEWATGLTGVTGWFGSGGQFYAAEFSTEG
jgi:hypothetical protein